MSNFPPNASQSTDSHTLDPQYDPVNGDGRYDGLNRMNIDAHDGNSTSSLHPNIRPVYLPNIRHGHSGNNVTQTSNSTSTHIHGSHGYVNSRRIPLFPYHTTRPSHHPSLNRIHPVSINNVSFQHNNNHLSFQHNNNHLQVVGRQYNDLLMYANNNNVPTIM